MTILYRLPIITGIGLCLCRLCRSLISVSNVGSEYFNSEVGHSYFISVDKMSKIFYYCFNEETLCVQCLLY